jgi:hypothetical protein
MHQRRMKKRTLIYCMKHDNYHANTCTLRCFGTMRGREVVPSFEIGVGPSEAPRRCCHGVPRESCHGVRQLRQRRKQPAGVRQCRERPAAAASAAATASVVKCNLGAVRPPRPPPGRPAQRDRREALSVPPHAKGADSDFQVSRPGRPAGDHGLGGRGPAAAPARVAVSPCRPLVRPGTPGCRLTTDRRLTTNRRLTTGTRRAHPGTADRGYCDVPIQFKFAAQPGDSASKYRGRPRSLATMVRPAAASTPPGAYWLHTGADGAPGRCGAWPGPWPRGVWQTGPRPGSWPQNRSGGSGPGPVPRLRG